MAHVMYDVVATARMTGAAMAASQAQSARMLAGAVALRDASARAAVARAGRDRALDRLAQARAARAAFRAR